MRMPEDKLFLAIVGMTAIAVIVLVVAMYNLLP